MLVRPFASTDLDAAIRQEIRQLAFKTGATFLGLAVLAVIILFVPSLSPYGFFQFWTLPRSWLEVIWHAIPIFSFMVVLNAIPLFTTWNGYKENLQDIFQMGFAISAWAGIVEEIFFRWLCFFGAMVAMPLLNGLIWWLTGYELVRDFYVGIVLPTADFFTLGYLHDVLRHEYWVVGAAVITANGQFRNGHAYQGFFGFTLSWFFGMYMYWFVLNYGLLSAILVHFLTDWLIFLTVWFDAWSEKNGFQR